jgi:hypothetical protein
LLSTLKPTDRVDMQLRRDEAAAECDALLKDKSNEAMEQISLGQNPLKLQALIEPTATN